MSTRILSTVLPDALASRVRDLASIEDRSVSNVLRRLLTDALENDNGGPAKAAAVKTGEGTADECQV